MIEPSLIQDASTKKVLVKTNNVAVFTKSGLSLVEPISLTLHQGQNVTILGETGSGKSLLAQAIMGALPEELVAQGDILIEKQSLTNRNCVHIGAAVWRCYRKSQAARSILP